MARHPNRVPWTPLQRGIPNPELDAIKIAANIRPTDEVWYNEVYQITVTYLMPNLGRLGPMHLSLKRNDRQAIHDWRHLQAIKNEIAGPEREAVEIYPSESRLVDSANEYHLWVFPDNTPVPFGFDEYLVSSDFQVRDFNEGRERGDHKGRQREFQPNLPVAVKRNHQEGADQSLTQTYLQPHGLRTPTQ